MKLLRSATIAAFVAVSACSNGQVSSPTAPSVSHAVTALNVKLTASPQAINPILYVLNFDGSDLMVTIYSGRGKTYLRTIDLGQFGDTDTAAFGSDRKGLLYVSVHHDRQYKSTLSVYNRGGAKILRQLKQRPAFGYLTFDSSGNLYTTCRRSACEFAGGKQSIIWRLPASMGPYAVDSSGNFATTYYAADQISIFAPLQSQPFWQTKTGTNYTLNSLAFDSSGNLYAMNSYAPSQQNDGSVAVYSPGDSNPSVTITDGIYRPAGIAFDPTGDLNVLNQKSITIYRPGSSHPARTITKGIKTSYWTEHPGAGQPLAIDSAGYIFVANPGSIASPPDPGSVTVYSPSGKLVRTVTSGIQNPVAIAGAPY